MVGGKTVKSTLSRLLTSAAQEGGDKGQFGLNVRAASDQRVEASFPPHILDGRYTLVAVNGAGQDQAYVELDLPWLTPEQLITRINENESDTKLSAAVLPVGTTGDHVAAGNHEHAGVYAVVSHEHADLVQTSDARLSDARAPTAGSPDYIQNQTGTHQNASFDIAGTGSIGGNVRIGGTVTIGGKYIVSANGEGVLTYHAPDGQSYELNPGSCDADTWCCSLPSNAICFYNHTTNDDVLELSLVGANSQACIVAAYENDAARRFYYGTDNGNRCRSGAPCLQLREVGSTTTGPVPAGASYAIICF